MSEKMQMSEIFSLGRNEQIASILANENIHVRFSNIPTAAFSPETRTLLLPMWKGVQKELLDMLIIHEVGHALDDDIVYPRNPIHKSYTNIIDDVRIDRKQRLRYPGCKKDYYIGSKILHEELDLFKLKGKNVADCAFIDRINLYSKIGQHISIPFSEAEKEILEVVFEAETGEDIENIVLALIERDKELLRQEAEKKKVEEKVEQESCEAEENEDSGEEETETESSESETTETTDGDSEDGDSEEEETETESSESETTETTDGDSEDGDSEDGEETEETETDDVDISLGGEGIEDDDDEDEGDSINFGSSDSSEDDSEEEEEIENGDTEDSENGVGGGKGDDVSEKPSETEETTEDEEPELDAPETADAFDNFKNDIETEDWTKEPSYMTVGKIPSSEIMDPLQFRNAIKSSKNGTKQFIDNLRTKLTPAIDVLKKQFEVLKQAKVQSAYVTNKGVIDVNCLHLHSITDNIFTKTVETISNAENHRLVMLLDYSGSMRGNNIKLLSEQLFILREFCNDVNIPFSAFTFAGETACVLEVLNEKDSDDYFQKFIYNLHYMNLDSFGFESGRTPLNQSMDLIYTYLRELKSTMQEDKLNFIFLTDGQATDPFHGAYDEEAVIVDHHTKKHYHVPNQRYTHCHYYTIILEMMRDSGILHSISAYRFIGSKRELKALPIEINKGQFKRNKLVKLVDFNNTDETYFIWTDNSGRFTKSHEAIETSDKVGDMVQKLKTQTAGKNMSKTIAKSFSKLIA